MKCSVEWLKQQMDKQTIPLMPHRKDSERDHHFLTRLLIWCYENHLDNRELIRLDVVLSLIEQQKKELRQINFSGSTISIAEFLGETTK